MAIGLKRIETVYLPTTDPQKSAAWYVENLGVSLYHPAGENQAQLTLESGQSIFLIKTAVPISLTYPEATGTEQCIMTVEVNDISAMYNQVKEKGVEVSDLEDNGECGLNFYLLDLDGNKLDIWGGWPKRNNMR